MCVCGGGGIDYLLHHDSLLKDFVSVNPNGCYCDHLHSFCKTGP